APHKGGGEDVVHSRNQPQEPVMLSVPDRSIRNRKHDGFLRLISAVYDILTASFVWRTPVAHERRRPPSVRPHIQSCPAAALLSRLRGSPVDGLHRLKTPR